MTLKQPSFTHRLTEGREELVQLGGSYLYRMVAEDRSALNLDWIASASGRGMQFSSVVDEAREEFVVRCASDDEPMTVSTRSRRELSAFVRSLPEPVVVDVTGLDHSTWAPLLRALVAERISHYLVYTEPTSYRRSPSPSQSLLFDLSERISGIAPLPGFGRLPIRDEPVRDLIALVGFEGSRLGNVSNELDISPSGLHPILGLPGFRAEHPFLALEGNMEHVYPERLARSLVYARANCPFEAFDAIVEIAESESLKVFLLAPIGTKPHGVGAVLLAILAESRVELVYDHPVRRSKRSTGTGSTYLYDVSGFLRSTQCAEGLRRIGA